MTNNQAEVTASRRWLPRVRSAGWPRASVQCGHRLSNGAVEDNYYRDKTGVNLEAAKVDDHGSASARHGDAGLGTLARAIRKAATTAPSPSW